MTTLCRFRIVRLLPAVQKELGLPELICADPDGLPFVEGQAFYHWVVDDNACEPATARNYLHAILPFLTFLWMGTPSLRYTASAEQIRQQVRLYLREKLNCVVRPHPGGNFVVRQPKTVTVTSARLFLTALRRFYSCATLKGWYPEASPLEWQSRLIQKDEFKPQMPPQSGLTAPQSKRGRVPDTYFCIVAGDWQPRILDDDHLPELLLPNFTKFRDQLITRLLCESGARISEVLGLTLGDWRKKGQQNRAWTTNKGSYGERVKEIWWSAETAQLLRNYVSQERRQCDPRGAGLDDLPDSAPLFITDDGAPYTYKTFYFHWRQACERAHIRITPHQIRHWFVTRALRFIEGSEIDPEKRKAYRQALITYIHWRCPETIQAYDHHLHQLDFAPIHAALASLEKPDQRSATPPPSEEAGPVAASSISAELARLLQRAMKTEE